MPSSKDAASTVTTSLAARFYAARPVVDWSKSTVGREVWMAWNALESAMIALECASLRDVSAALEDLKEKRGHMLTALRDRDKEARP